jgi:5-methylcytosine-specific restriction endonuclease McrA
VVLLRLALRNKGLFLLRASGVDVIVSRMDKRCPMCEQFFPPATFLTKNGAKKPYCVECTKAYKRASYAKNPEPAKRNAKLYAEKNKDTYTAYQKEYRETHRQEINEGAKVYRIEHKEEIREKSKVRCRKPEYLAQQMARHRYRMEHDEEYRERILRHSRKGGRTYYRKHRMSILSALRDSYWSNIEASRRKVRESLTRWRSRNVEKCADIQRKRRAVRKGSLDHSFDGVAHTRHLFVWQDSRCYHCNRPISNGDVHMDHLYPIALGGQHHRENLALSCPECNLSKGARILGDQWKSPWFTEDEKRFVCEDELRNLFGENAPVKIISSFYLSERNLDRPDKVMTNMRDQYPDCILLFDWEWWERRDACINMISSKMGTAKRSGTARKSEVREISTDDAREFLDAHHVQGWGKGSVYVALISDDKIIGCSAWIIGEDRVELNRLAFDGSVPGGFGKLLSAFKSSTNYAGQPIISFVDRRYATGASYAKLGFTYDGETDAPVYYYVNGGGMFHRRQFRKNALEKRLTFFDASLSEKSIAMANGFFKLFGLKQGRFLLTD